MVPVVSVVESVAAELDRFGAADGPEGQIALALARNIDAARNGMATSPDARTLLDILTAIRDKRALESDSVDDATSRRAAKLHAVGS